MSHCMLNRWIHHLHAFLVRVTNSIAFYPVLIALSFLLLSGIMLEWDFSSAGKSLKSDIKWLRLQDANTARSIVSTIAAGIISLTVFSFSMVMIVLTQTASQISNRMLESLIGNRLHQAVLGCYLGTIVYALFLLTTIRDIDSGIQIPSLSITLLIFITILDIFLFIYFLHYVTQSSKYETLIHRIRMKTRRTLSDHEKPEVPNIILPEEWTETIYTRSAGYFQGINGKALAKLAKKNDWVIRVARPAGVYLLAGQPLLQVQASKELSLKDKERLLQNFDFFVGQQVTNNGVYGFRHLTEVAIKALSPGINDPATAVLSLNALFDLLYQYQLHPPALGFVSEDGVTRVINNYFSFEELFKQSILPIWDYGKGDRLIRSTLRDLVTQVQAIDDNHLHDAIYRKLLDEMNTEEEKNNAGL